MAANKPVFPASNKPPHSQEGRLQASQERELGRVLTDVRKIKDGRIAGAFALPSVPTGGTFAQGDVVRNSDPSLTLSGTDQYFIHGWEYVSEGSGTLTWMPIKIWTLETAGISAATLTATNVGTGKGVYLGESGGILQMRTLKSGPGTGITISASGNELAFDLTFTPFTAASQTATNIGTGAGLYAGLASGVAQYRTLKSAGGLTVSVSGNEIVLGGYSFSAGGIPFAGSDGLLSVTASNLRYDASNVRLGIGGVPDDVVHARGSVNGRVAVKVENLTDGTGANTSVQLYTASGQMGILSATPNAFTTDGLFVPHLVNLRGLGVGGVLINAENASGNIVFCTAGHATTNERARIYANGDVQLGTNSLTVSSSVGFVHIPSVAGAPVAVPVTHTGFVPMCYDRTNNHFYIYNGGWKKTTVFA